MADDFVEQNYPIEQPYKGIPYVKIGDNSIFMDKPDKVVKVSDNEVRAEWSKYGLTQTITAEGSGNERHNFVERIEVTE